MSELGAFLLAVQVSGVVLLVGASVQQVVQPKLIKSLQTGDIRSVATLYVLACFLGPLCAWCAYMVFALFGDALFFFITGEYQEFEVAKIASMLALGAGAVNVMAVVFAIQNSVGVLRFHWLGSSLFIVVQLCAAMYILRDQSVWDFVFYSQVLNIVYILFFGSIVSVRFIRGYNLWTVGAIVCGAVGSLSLLHVSKFGWG